MILLGLSLAPLIALAEAVGIVRESDASQEAKETPQATTPQVRRVVIRGQLVIRIPVRPKNAGPARYRLADGPRCVASDEIVGARLAGTRSIDFLMKDRSLLRMTTDRDCPSLDFYGGFYLHPGDDRLCARRDMIRTRMGSSCRINTFQQVEPVATP